MEVLDDNSDMRMLVSATSQVISDQSGEVISDQSVTNIKYNITDNDINECEV